MQVDFLVNLKFSENEIGIRRLQSLVVYCWLFKFCFGCLNFGAKPELQSPGPHIPAALESGCFETQESLLYQKNKNVIEVILFIG